MMLWNQILKSMLLHLIFQSGKLKGSQTFVSIQDNWWAYSDRYRQKHINNNICNEF